MNDTVKTATLVGDPVDAPDQKIAKPKSRAEKIADWRIENGAAYRRALDHQACCSPTRQHMLLIEQWQNPPVD